MAALSVAATDMCCLIGKLTTGRRCLKAAQGKVRPI